MKKIMLVFGTRPEAIKMAPLVLEFKKFPDLFEVVVCVTGQHRQMLDQVIELFQIKTDYDLNIMKPNQDLYEISSTILLGLREVFEKAQPDIVFVHGDTTTSTMAALSAFYQHIPVAHVEAGLRTYNKYSPWPEEMNRMITGRLATYNFCPTKLSYQNLKQESISEESMIITGNTVIDALLYVRDQLVNVSEIRSKVELEIVENGYDLISNDKERKIVLVTGHRRESFGGGFINICQAINELSELYKDVDFVYPVHFNPNVRKAIEDVFGVSSDSISRGTRVNGNVIFMNPLDYLPFVYLMSRSYIILTDSGGIQEEAPSLGKPVLVMRDNTERPEAIEAGTVRLVGTDIRSIVDNTSLLLNDENIYKSMAMSVNPYGDGKASSRIVDFISHL